MVTTLPGSKRYRDLGEISGVLTDLVRVCVGDLELWAWAPYNGNPMAQAEAAPWDAVRGEAVGELVVVFQPGCKSCEAGDTGCHNCHKVEPDVTKKCPACGCFEQVVVENEPWE